MLRLVLNSERRPVQVVCRWQIVEEMMVKFPVEIQTSGGDYEMIYVWVAENFSIFCLARSELYKRRSIMERCKSS